MKRTIPIILGIIWLFLISGLAFSDGADWSYKESMNLCQDGIKVENSFYIIDNREKENVIYHIDANHQVEDLFLSSSYKEGVSIESLSFSDDLYVLLKEAEDGSYRILKLDEEMYPVEESRLLIPKEKGELTGFVAKEDGFYLTVVTKKGEKAVTYLLEKNGSLEPVPPKEKQQIKEVSVPDPSSLKEEPAFLKMVRMSEAPKNRRIVEAAFEDGEYKIRLDNGVGKEDFLLEEEILDAFYGRQLSIRQTLGFQQEQLIFYLQLLMAGYVVLILGSVILKNRNHTVYTIVIVELILMIVTFSGMRVTYGVVQDTVITQNKRFGLYYLQELKRKIGPDYKAFIQEETFHNSESYYEMWEKMESFLQEEGPDKMFHSLALVRVSDGRIMAGTAGKNMEHGAYQYGTAIVPALEQMKQGYDNADTQVLLEGNSYQVMVLSDKDGTKSEYCYVGLLKTETASFGEEAEKYIMYGWLIFLLGSILSIGLILLQALDLRRLAKSMFRVACGDYDIKKEKAYGKDVEMMWNSLLDIRKKISRINYAKFQLYESCYRFAPKNIEKILERESITEVKSGDAIELFGTLAMINTSKTFHMNIPTMGQVNRYVELMEKHKEKMEGFFLAGSNNLKNMKILFQQECRESAEFGINFMKEFQQMKAYDHFHAGILLHYDQYIYGVAGSENQCFSFLFYKKMEKLEKLGNWLQDKEIKMTITEAVKIRESITSGIRYIGYIEFEEEQMKLYEVLDACSDEERKRKEALDVKFQKALELFYQYDFYLARSSFSEIIRENPQDQIAKWYLFTCQKYLNQAYRREVNFELWEKD